MRIQFIAGDSLAVAAQQVPWAATIICVEGGFMAFESVDDATIFTNQQ